MSRIQANKDYILETAKQLEAGTPLTEEQMSFWASVLRRIGEGEPADRVLNLKRRKGEQATTNTKRQKISLVLHLIASHYQPLHDPRLPPPRKYTLEEAIEKVMPEVKRIMGDNNKYEMEMIKSWWYDRDKAHMRSPLRNQLDPDNPYR